MHGSLAPHISLNSTHKPLIVRRSARLSTTAPGPMRESARFCTLSSRARWDGAAPFHTRGQYSIRGRTKPLYAVRRPGGSRTGDAFRRKPMRWVARSVTDRRCWPKFMVLSNVTPKSLRVVTSSTATPPNRKGAIGRGCGEKSKWRARRQNLLRGSCDPAFSYTPTIPSRPSLVAECAIFLILRLVATHSRRAVLHLVEGTPDDGPADTTLWIAFMDVGVLERTEGETETTTRWTRSFTTLDHLNSEVHLLHCSLPVYQVADGLRRVDTVRSVHREDSFQKIKGF